MDNLEQKLHITPSNKDRNNFIKIVILVYLAPVFREITVTFNIENGILEFIIWWIPSLLVWKIASEIYYAK